MYLCILLFVKKKLLFVHSYLEPGGAEVLRLNISTFFNKEKYDLVVCSLSTIGIIGTELRSKGVNVIALNRSWSIYHPATTYALYKLIRKEKPDIVQCAMFNAVVHGVIAGMAARVPIIIAEEHSPAFFKKWYHRLIDRILLKFVNKIIACSEYVKEFMAENEGISLEKFKVIYNCINVAPFEKKISLKECTEVKRKLGLTERDYPVIGQIGRLHEAKGHINLLRALPMILKTYPHAKVLIIGEGPLHDMLKQDVAQHRLKESVLFLGQRRDLNLCYSILDVLAFPSVYEGFGITLLEAFYKGIPCVATNVGGIPEVVGDCGVLVEPNNPQELAQGIIEIIKDSKKRKQIIVNAKKRVTERFLPEQYVKQLELLYEELSEGVR